MFNELYINLIKKVLIDYHRSNFIEYTPIESNQMIKSLIKAGKIFNKKKEFAICYQTKYKLEDRVEGKDWPLYADTMIGLKRLENIEFCFKEIIKNDIPGDFIETGVWRGGAAIFMRALLKASNINNRIVFLADSFEGLPVPDEEKYLMDKGSKFYLSKELSIPIEEVKNNFRKYELLDENVKFLKGWFHDTLPAARIDALALLRLDGDMYSSTMDALVNLYPKLSKGGYIIIDDWGAIKGCKQAVIDYRKEKSINEEIIEIDWTGVFWKKQN